MATTSSPTVDLKDIKNASLPSSETPIQLDPATRTTTPKSPLKSFAKWLLTPKGFLITIYGLNVVAWGGMLFLLLCNASPAMCHPSCNDIDSPRRKWIEIDSQILNALFCIPGFGLAPWRARDLYLWVKWRGGKSEAAFARLCEIHKGWFYPGDKGGEGRRSGSAQDLLERGEGGRDQGEADADAEATPLWKMDSVIWLFVWNTILQGCLAGCMWGMNRYNRPSWTTGLFVAAACIVSAVAGWICFQEGKRTRKWREAVST